MCNDYVALVKKLKFNYKLFKVHPDIEKETLRLRVSVRLGKGIDVSVMLKKII